jgi:glyoxylase I family protein
VSASLVPVADQRESPHFNRALHIGLTVRDMDASARWYQRALGFRLVKRFDAADGTGIPRTLLLHPRSGFLVGLYNHHGRSDDQFSPFRTGLDHLAFEVESQQTLDAWVDHLDSEGIDHSPIRDVGHSRFVSLEDPDGIQLEIWLTLIPHQEASPT